jgi:hypothetical protein
MIIKIERKPKMGRRPLEGRRVCTKLPEDMITRIAKEAEEMTLQFATRLRQVVIEYYRMKDREA